MPTCEELQAQLDTANGQVAADQQTLSDAQSDLSLDANDAALADSWPGGLTPQQMLPSNVSLINGRIATLQGIDPMATAAAQAAYQTVINDMANVAALQATLASDQDNAASIQQQMTDQGC